MTNKHLLVLFLTMMMMSSTAAAISEKKSCNWTHLYTVYLANNLPPESRSPMSVQCKSKEDDLGDHAVARNQDFHFDFCDSFSGNTLFYCNVRWENKSITFNAFKEKLSHSNCGGGFICYWVVKSDGIYFSEFNPPRGLVKKYGW